MPTENGGHFLLPVEFPVLQQKEEDKNCENFEKEEGVYEKSSDNRRLRL